MHGACGARLAAARRHRRDREDGTRPRGHRGARPRAAFRTEHPYLGSGSVHASLIEGGQEFSSYPARCCLQAERRTIPGRDAELAEQELREIVARAGEGDPHFSPRSRPRSHASRSRSPRRRRSCSSCAATVTAVLGRRAGARRRACSGRLGASGGSGYPDRRLRSDRRGRARRGRVGRRRVARAVRRDLLRASPSTSVASARGTRRWPRSSRRARPRAPSDRR